MKFKEIPINIGEYLQYNPHTGEIVWVNTLTKNMHKLIGTTAGTLKKHKYTEKLYIAIHFNKEQYQHHRVAWFLMTGKQPSNEIDHWDGNGLNNAWDNLRDATRGNNTQNAPKREDNTSGYKGVTFHKPTGKWRTRIQINGKRISLGLFNTPEEAYLAYCEAADKYHKEFANYG